MSYLTQLKKIIVVFVLATPFVMPESVLSDELQETEGVTSELPDLSEKPVDSKTTLDLSLPYNSFDQEKGWMKQLWGRPFRDKLYLGMWTLHLESGDDQESNNQLIGATYKGYYGGTFINTHRDRVWSGGWQRTLFQQKYGEIEVEAGYRAGMMYGYKRYLKLGNSRWFPLFQALLDVEYKNFGVQFSWAGVVLTAGFYYRF
ncbi:hypothetical protein GZ77_19440 [Endozoicomonas montiporae]|uniref:Uncharacterized protein n=2 Tax=Endozoicomonas montiporae TaxID=1027273 RepID=A0A081N2J3_9GAMM|nr:hypothetical protein [Endozoicomonas montiporae]AMO54788.1 hypothetical protein EZMO1_0541 [Endozoicomonas montiporae CL-33]KEQ12666.1 hypothetical protein GZ77_19440 [Endozoicomonas montiporae]